MITANRSKFPRSLMEVAPLVLALTLNPSRAVIKDLPGQTLRKWHLIVLTAEFRIYQRRAALPFSDE